MALSTRPAVDALIIGGGPAGLTSAVSIARNCHTAVVFDSKEYRNARSNHMHMMPTWDGKDPKTFRAAARQNTTENYDHISFVDTKIVQAKRNADETFEVQNAEGESWIGKALILAVGTEDVMLDIPGFEECWGRSIYHCLFCYGYEQRGSPSSGILDLDPNLQIPLVNLVARNALQLSKVVTLYTNGNEDRAASLKSFLSDKEPIQIDTRKIIKFTLGDSLTGVTITFEDGSTKYESFLACKPEGRLRSSDLAHQLGLELTPVNDIKATPPFGETSVPGCFAAGDGAGQMKMTANAVNTGALAASGAAAHIQSRLYGQKSLLDIMRDAAKKPSEKA